jgi:hypothetical protein
MSWNYHFSSLVSIFVLFFSYILVVSSKEKASWQLEDYKIFMIAGTQKSGTTALAAMLAGHPQIAFSNRKELHFFDKNKTYHKGLTHYMRYFAPIPQRTVYLGEATPYYIASRDACARIQKDFPEAKLLILLREPIDRAYSEYQMKLRRVENQQSFFNLLQSSVSSIYPCLQQYANDNQATEWNSNLKQCFPKEIQDHGFFSKFQTAMKKSFRKKRSWKEILNQCFSLSYLNENGEEMYHASTQNDLDTNNNIQEYDYDDDDENNNNNNNNSIDKKKSNDIPHQHDVLSDTNQENHHDDIAMSVSPSGSLSALNTGEADSSSFQAYNITFEPSNCWRDYRTGYEKVLPLKEALLDEAHNFSKCSLAYFQSHYPHLLARNNQSVEANMTANIAHIVDEIDVDDRLAAYDKAIDHCYTIKGGISTQYIYRSLYAIQMYHCLQVLSSSQFMVLPSEYFRQSPDEVLLQILEFLKLDTSSFETEHWIEVATAQVNQTISRRYKGKLHSFYY